MSVEVVREVPMKKWLSLILACTACGGEDDPDASLIGHWTSKEMTLTLTKGDYTLQRLAGLSSVVQAEIHAGQYTASSTDLIFAQRQSSCPGDTREESTVGYRISGDTLVVLFPDGLVSFKPGKKASEVSSGCFIGGLFMQSPLVTLP